MQKVCFFAILGLFFLFSSASAQEVTRAWLEKNVGLPHQQSARFEEEKIVPRKQAVAGRVGKPKMANRSMQLQKSLAAKSLASPTPPVTVARNNKNNVSNKGSKNFASSPKSAVAAQKDEKQLIREQVMSALQSSSGKWKLASSGLMFHDPSANGSLEGKQENKKRLLFFDISSPVTLFAEDNENQNKKSVAGKKKNVNNPPKKQKETPKKQITPDIVEDTSKIEAYLSTRPDLLPDVPRGM